jgi:simple sugar transport system permease protein
MKRFSSKKFFLAVAAPLSAAVVSILISSIALLATKKSPIEAFKTMWQFGATTSSVIETLNTSTSYYIAAIAIAITFRAGLFNIGVEGQLRLAALFSMYFGAMFTLPPVLHVLAIFLIAMTVGGLWAAIAGVLKVKRGVNEVISTIMLNSIAGALSAYLFSQYFSVKVVGSNNLSTAILPKSGQMPNLSFITKGMPQQTTQGRAIYGMLVIAILLGVAFWLIVNRTRFGFELRASGINPIAARVSGVNSKRMIVIAMISSGAIAGLSGLPTVLAETHAYNMGFRSGLGFSAIAIALLGRNGAVGMAFSSLLFSFLEVSSRSLELIDVAPETYYLMQGAILLSSVIAFEVVGRYKVKVVAEELAQAVAHA